MPTIPPEILQFGIAGLLFVVWWSTFKFSTATFQKVAENNNATVTKLAAEAAAAYTKAIDDSREMNKELLKIIRESGKDNEEILSHLHTVLTRIEQKLDQPVQCTSQNRPGGN